MRLSFILLLIISAKLSAQIKEPVKESWMSKEQYMLMLIDSLTIAEQNHDSLNVIKYASVLTTKMHGTKIRSRANYYLSIALNYAKNYSDSRWYAEVCNRAGMLKFSLRDISDTTQFLLMTDSSIYWHELAVMKGAEDGTEITQGWGHRGVMSVLIDLHKKGFDDYTTEIDRRFEIILRIALKNEDEELLSHSSLRYGHFLATEGRSREIEDVVKRLDPAFFQGKSGLLVSFYSLIHDHIATKNHLDTLAVLGQLTITEFDKNVSAEYFENLIEKDQKYEVSKTKGELIAVEESLDFSNRVILIIVCVAVILLFFSGYIFLLYQKNRNLSLKNKLLLKEQNHRVKNNLQMINSLLSLQSQKLLSTDAKEALNESQMRINSVALLHRMLYEGEQIGTINVKNYISTLVDEIKYASPRQIEFDLSIEEKLSLRVEKATSLGLIINELLTNSIKHVDASIPLKVDIEIIEKSNELILSYLDNGEGIEEQVWEKSQSFGNQLIRIQSEQLRGTYLISTRNGFHYQLKISA